MIERTSEIAEIKAQVLLITYDEPALLREKMAHDLHIPYPLLLDPDKQAYRRWGMGRTNVMGAMLSPALNVRYVKLLLKGERFLGLAPDMYQLGGDFVIDSQGRIAFAHTHAEQWRSCRGCNTLPRTAADSGNGSRVKMT